MIKTCKKHLASLLAVFMLAALFVPTSFAASNLYSSSESFSELSITAGKMVSDEGGATLIFTEDKERGEGTFSVENDWLVATSRVTCTEKDAGSAGMTYSDARLVYDLGENVNGKVEVNFSFDLSATDGLLQSAWNGQTPESMFTFKNSNGEELMDIVYDSNTLWLDENATGNHLFGNVHGGAFDIKLVFDFAAGTVTATGTKSGTSHTATLNLKNGLNLRSIVFNFNGNFNAIGSANLEFKIGHIQVNQTEEIRALYQATEGFDAFAFTDGEKSDTGYGTFTFVKDANEDRLQFGTFVKNGSNIAVCYLPTYDAATGVVTPSTAQMTYTLPEAISGKVEVSMDVWFSNYLADVLWTDWLVAKDSEGNTIMDIDFANNNLYVFAATEETENYCQHPDCLESSNSNNASYIHTSNVVSEFRNLKLVLDFDEGTMYFYRNGEIATHKSTGHTYIMKLQNNAKDLKSIEFNFKGTATASVTSYEWRTIIDSFSVKQFAMGAAESRITDSNVYETADNTMETIKGVNAEDSLTASVTVENQATSTRKATLYAAIYKENGQLAKVASNSMNIDSTGIETITVNLDVPEDIGENAYIRLFVWDENLKPFDGDEMYN